MAKRRAYPDMGSGVNPNTPVRLFDTHPNRRIAVGEEVVMIDHEQPNVRGLVLGYAAEDRLWVQWPTVTAQEDVHDVIAMHELGNVVSLRDTGVVTRPQSVHTPGAYPKKTAGQRRAVEDFSYDPLQRAGDHDLGMNDFDAYRVGRSVDFYTDTGDKLDGVVRESGPDGKGHVVLEVTYDGGPQDKGLWEFEWPNQAIKIEDHQEPLGEETPVQQRLGPYGSKKTAARPGEVPHEIGHNDMEEYEEGTSTDFYTAEGTPGSYKQHGYIVESNLDDFGDGLEGLVVFQSDGILWEFDWPNQATPVEGREASRHAGKRGARFSFRKVRKGGGHAFEVYVGDNHVGNIRQTIKSGKRFWKCEGRKREKLYATRKEAAEALCSRKKCGSIRLCGDSSQIKLRRAAVNPQGQYPQSQQPLELGLDPQFSDYNLGITMDEVFGQQQQPMPAQPRPQGYPQQPVVQTGQQPQPIPAQPQPQGYPQQPVQPQVQQYPQQRRMGPYGSKMKLDRRAVIVDLKGDIEDVRPHRLRVSDNEEEIQRNASTIRGEGVRELDNMLRVLRAARRQKEAKIAARITRTAMVLHLMYTIPGTNRQASSKSVTQWWKRRLRVALTMTKKLRKLNQGRYASVADRMELALQKAFTYPTRAVRFAGVENPPDPFQLVFGQESFRAWDELLHRASSNIPGFDPMSSTYEQLQPLMVQMQNELRQGGVNYSQDLSQAPPTQEPGMFNAWHQQQTSIGNPLVTGQS